MIYYAVCKRRDHKDVEPVHKEVPEIVGELTGNIEVAVEKIRYIFMKCLDSSREFESMHIDDDGKYAYVVYKLWNNLKVEYFIAEINIPLK